MTATTNSDSVATSSVTESLAPRGADYAHNRAWGDDNGHSHVRACLIGPSLALPVVEGSVPLGTWQQVVLLFMFFIYHTCKLY